MAEVYWLGFGVFFLSLLITWMVRALAASLGTIDQPNERSSHSKPTPRGGGLAIVLASTVGTVMLLRWGLLDRPLALVLLGGGLPIALIGFMDDRGSLPVAVRFFAHLAVAVWSMYLLGGLPALEIGSRVVDLGIWGDVLGVLAIIWTLNLFNFMDGIDGLAASEAIFVCWGGAVVTLALGTGPAIPSVAVLIGAACGGFLPWNWPPARIFMGDVGSGFLGFAIAVLALAAARESPLALVVWLILGGVFFADATITLLRRISRGESAYQAHRTHAYQRLARRWGSHKSVTLSVVAANIMLLLPSAFLAVVCRSVAWWILLGVLVSVGLAVIAAGAGKKEVNSNTAELIDRS